MSKIQTAYKLWQKDHLSVIKPIFEIINNKGWLNHLSDKTFLKIAYRLRMSKKLDLSNPKAFSEKLQWLKLYDRKPIYNKMVDKYEVKEYVYRCIGGDYIIPTLGIWDSVDRIDWDSLPNSFVLKTTNGSGGFDVVICKDKSKFNKEDAIAKLNKSFDDHAFWYGREWPYKDLKPRIIAETFITDGSYPEGLPDYKFYCFNGTPYYCQVIRDRTSKETIDFYDMEWNHMPFVGLNPNCTNGSMPVKRPQNLENMIRVCTKLSHNIPFARVDLYVVNGKEYFGEITLYPASGYGRFTPSEWDGKLGELLNLEGVFGGV